MRYALRPPMLRWLIFGLFLLPLLTAAAQQSTAENFTVAYGGRVYDTATDRTTFTYMVAGTGAPPDLSHFDLEIPTCIPALQVAATTPTDAVSYGVDPTTGISGVKWDLPLQVSASRTYSLAFVGVVAEGSVQAAVKTGDGFFTVAVPGPSCIAPAIDIEKFISLDGVTWLDADPLPGPDVALDQTVTFRFVVTNTGNVPLSDLSLTDTLLSLAACSQPTTLEPDAFFECTVAGGPAVAGQHTNTATVTGVYQGLTVTDSDGANYFGGERPAVDIEKYVSTDGGANWADVDAAPGPQVLVGSPVSFRFVVTNTGTTPLTGIALSDSTLSLAACALPVELPVGQSTECIVGPQPAQAGQHSNTATVQALYNAAAVMDSDTAHYRGGDTELPVTIIIEGPVQTVNVNIITIYDINIEVATDDPILNVIQIGDFVRVEGDLADDDSSTLIVIAVFVTIVDVDVVINVNGEIWRDSGDCRNPPPPWAPANGWRRRCGGVIIIGDDGMGMGDDGMGMGDDD